MTPLEDLKRKKGIVDSFFQEALGVMEIATLHNSSIQDVLEVLRETQCGTERIRASERFKRKVVDFAANHPEISITNVARAFCLKDEKSVRTWCKIYSPSKPVCIEGKQYSLMQTQHGDETEKDLANLFAQRNAALDKYVTLKEKHGLLIEQLSMLLDAARSESA